MFERNMLAFQDTALFYFILFYFFAVPTYYYFNKAPYSSKTSSK